MHQYCEKASGRLSEWSFDGVCTGGTRRRGGCVDVDSQLGPGRALDPYQVKKKHIHM